MSNEMDDELALLEDLRREGERLAKLHQEHDFGGLRKRIRRRFQDDIVPLLRDLGFQGTFPHRYRDRGDGIDLVMFQVDRYGGGFTFNLGRGDPSRPGSEQRYAELPFDRRARLTRDASGREDKWFRYDGPGSSPEDQQDAAIDEVRRWLVHADGWFRGATGLPHVVE